METLAFLGNVAGNYQQNQLNDAKFNAAQDEGNGAKYIFAVDPATKQVQPLGAVPGRALPSTPSAMLAPSAGTPMPTFHPPAPTPGIPSAPFIPAAPNAPLTAASKAPPALPAQSPTSSAPQPTPQAPLTGAYQNPQGLVTPQAVVQGVLKVNPRASGLEIMAALNQSLPYMNLAGKQQTMALNNRLKVARLNALTNPTADTKQHYLSPFQITYQDALAGKYGAKYTNPLEALKLAEKASAHTTQNMAYDPTTGQVAPIKGSVSGVRSLKQAEAAGGAVGKSSVQANLNASQAVAHAQVLENSVSQVVPLMRQLSALSEDNPSLLNTLLTSRKYVNTSVGTQAQRLMAQIKAVTAGNTLSGIKTFLQGTGQVRTPELNQLSTLLSWNDKIPPSANIAKFQQGIAYMKTLVAQAARVAQAAQTNTVLQPQPVPGGSGAAGAPARTVSFSDLPR